MIVSLSIDNSRNPLSKSLDLVSFEPAVAECRSDKGLGILGIGNQRQAFFRSCTGNVEQAARAREPAFGAIGKMPAVSVRQRLGLEQFIVRKQKTSRVAVVKNY